MAESKTEQVNESQTLAQAIAELTAGELATDNFLLVLDVAGQRTFVSNGFSKVVHQLAHEALDFVHSMDGDELAVASLKQAGRLN